MLALPSLPVSVMSLVMAASALDCEREAIYTLQFFLRSGYINNV